MARLWLIVCALGWLGCAAEVIVEEDELTAGESTTGGQPGADCTLCGAMDCGLCRYEGGDFAFACRAGNPSGAMGECVPTGSLYEDEHGFYECWRCFAD